MTKSEEFKVFAGLVAALPDGYIRDILVEATPMIEAEVRNDMATASPISGMIAARNELAEEVKRLQDEEKAEASALASLRGELKRLQRAKEDAIAEIRVMARTAGIL